MSPSMPEPSNEFLSSRPQNVPTHLAIQVQSYKGRLQLAHTLSALTTVRRDIEHSNVQHNALAKEQLRSTANARAREVGHKDAADWWN